MNIYLDESYNLQRAKGKLFISISGFAVFNDKTLRKRWQAVRKPYLQSKRRIHATDSQFVELKERSIRLLGRHDVNILSVFQLIQEVPHDYFDHGGIKFDWVYTTLLKKLLAELSLDQYKKVKLVVDARKHRGGRLGEKVFRKDMENFLASQFSGTTGCFKATPSYMDTLVELADFVSNIFYKEYQSESEHVFQKLGFRLIQIKNPL